MVTVWLTAIVGRTKDLVGELDVCHARRAIRRLIIRRKWLPFEGRSIRSGRAMVRGVRPWKW